MTSNAGEWLDGPVDWTTVKRIAGVKSDLHQTLQIGAFVHARSVQLIRFTTKDTNDNKYFGEIADKIQDQIRLHDADVSGFRLVTWSPYVRSSTTALLAIATVKHVEIWQVECTTSAIRAAYKTQLRLEHVRGMIWHPTQDILMLWTPSSLHLVTIDHQTDQLHRLPLVHEDESLLKRDDAWKCAIWSPCGTCLLVASKHSVYSFKWKSLDHLTDLTATEVPQYQQVTLSANSSLALEALDAPLGSVVAISMPSPTICVVATDTPVVLDNLPSSVEEPSIPSIVQLPSSSNSSLRSTRDDKPGLIDLTALRVSRSSADQTWNSLQILPRPTQDSALVHKQRPSSHLLVVVRNADSWTTATQIALPSSLTCPDLLMAQDMRVVVASSINSHLLAYHLDQELTIRLSGQLSLPPSIVGRGLVLWPRSPFFQVAATEKTKSTNTFFHATTTTERLQLLKFKFPRRARPETKAIDTKPPSEPNSLGLETHLQALETKLLARFDRLERLLERLDQRLSV